MRIIPFCRLKQIGEAHFTTFGLRKRYLRQIHVMKLDFTANCLF